MLDSQGVCVTSHAGTCVSMSEITEAYACIFCSFPDTHKKKEHDEKKDIGESEKKIERSNTLIHHYQVQSRCAHKRIVQCDCAHRGRGHAKRTCRVRDGNRHVVA